MILEALIHWLRLCHADTILLLEGSHIDGFQACLFFAILIVTISILEHKSTTYQDEFYNLDTNSKRE